MDLSSEDPLSRGSVEQQLAALRSRVHRLEGALEAHGIPLEAPFQPVPSPAETIPGPPEIAAVEVAIPPASPAAIPAPVFQSLGHPSKDNRSLENRIGSQLFNRIGILAVLIGMAWFLKLAIDNHWIGPAGRVIIGLIAGAGLIAWSERFRGKGYAAFSYSLNAIGSGILYLSLWASFSLFHLVPASAAFAAMILVTAFNGFLCWLQNSELLALYAIVGGFSTPLLLSTGENHEVTLFGYLLILNLAALLLLALRPWSRLLLGAFLGTVLFFIGWWLSFYSNMQFGTTAFFLAAFFLLFAFAPRLIRSHALEENASIGFGDTLALVLLPLANAVFGFLGFYALLASAGDTAVEPWLAVAFAAFYLLMLRLPTVGALRAGPPALSALHLTAAVVFLTIAIPLKAHGRWITIGWLVEGAAILWLSRRIESALLRVLALLALALGLIALVTLNPQASTTILFNERFGTYLVGVAVFAFTAWLAAQAPRRTEHEAHALLDWLTIAGASVLVMNALILIAVGWEVHNFWWYVRYTGNWSVMREYRMYAQFTYSAEFMLFGALLLALGFWRQSAFLRWQALVLLAATIGKVFLIDVSELSQGYRILSFLGLGALLLAVSFVYQRDWLGLRHTEEKPENSAS
jgi:uncharacterized membrane protein